MTSRGTRPAEPERIQSRVVAGMIGLSMRTVQLMAARREIPGAARFGRRWTFDVAKVRRWIAEREAAACRVAPPS